MAKQDNTDGPYSLAIEQNSLSLEQVSALFDGKRMVEPARDIQEVRNAFAAYEALSRWNPTDRTHLLEAHGLLMGVGIYRGDQLVHMATSGQADQQGDLAPFVSYQLEAIHDALRSEIGSEMRSEIDAVILRDLAAEPTLSARCLAEQLRLSQRAGRLLRHGSPRAGTWQVL